MPRKPIHLELAGGKSQRQRIWENIRRFGQVPFDLSSVTPGDVPRATARDYLKGLACAGYLSVSPSPQPSPGGRGGIKGSYTLTRDVGIEAPRVRRNGEEVTQGHGNEALWGAMLALRTFNTRVLANMAGVKETTTKSYCMALERAGYLTIDRAGKGTGKGGILANYRLLTSRVQGPRPPMITRLKAVYDPNIHQIVWQQNADDALEELETVK